MARGVENHAVPRPHRVRLAPGRARALARSSRLRGALGPAVEETRERAGTARAGTSEGAAWKRSPRQPAPRARGHKMVFAAMAVMVWAGTARAGAQGRPDSSSSTRCCGATHEDARPATTTRSSTKRSKGWTSSSADTRQRCGRRGPGATCSRSTRTRTTTSSDTSPSPRSSTDSRSTGSPVRRRSDKGKPRRAQG